MILLRGPLCQKVATAWKTHFHRRRKVYEAWSKVGIKRTWGTRSFRVNDIQFLRRMWRLGPPGNIIYWEWNDELPMAMVAVIQNQWLNCEGDMFLTWKGRHKVSHYVASIFILACLLSTPGIVCSIRLITRRPLFNDHLRHVEQWREPDCRRTADDAVSARAAKF